MPVVAADLCIEVRWTAPMGAPPELLEHHCVVIRDGRILDILPSAVARTRYEAAVTLQRPTHLLMPGMINANADTGMALSRGGDLADGSALPPISAELAHDGVMISIAEMLRAGITCFSDRHDFPHATARAASGQGIRVVVGLPVGEDPQSLSRALSFRDEYGGHPLMSTAFAPQRSNALSDSTLSKISTLADELDAGIMIEVQSCTAEIEQSLALHGARPLERLWKLGLLSPALNAIHMVQVTESDIALAQRTGISIGLCLQGALRDGRGIAPVADFAAAGIRLGLGSAGYAGLSQDIWGELRLAAMLADCAVALRAATIGGAASLGLDGEIGSLEAGKWADLCCMDLAAPAMQTIRAPLAQIAFNGGRDLVSDVWVAGRHLLSAGELTRFDWLDVSKRRAG
jgi:5-methylthioadenosine/S-adenosylhomocysteine deaminase